MRIIYCGSFRLPNYDAASARVLNVARALRLAGHEISFISWGGQYREEDYCEDGTYRVDGFPYIVTNELDFKGNLLTKIKGKVYQGNKTRCLLIDRIGQYDAIIAYNCSLIRWLKPFCEKNNIRLVSDLTEWYEYSELKLFERPSYFYDMHFFQKGIKNKIVISSYLNRYYRCSHNVIVPATCDSSEFKWQKRASYNVDEKNGVTLIYAGNPARKDALHYVIRAVNRLVEEKFFIRFLIIGITREVYLNKYKDLLPNGELNKNILFLGRVSQDEVPAYYANADFMVLLREQTRKSNAGFPTKFSESFTSGTPVIANITSDLGDYLKDELTGFVVKESNEESIYQTLRERVLKLQRVQIEQMKNNVREVAGLLDYHAYVDRLNDFIKNLQ